MRRSRHQTSQAGTLAGKDHHGHAFRADYAAIDPGFVELDAGIVEEIARLEIVRGIKHHIHFSDERFDIARGHIESVCLDHDG